MASNASAPAMQLPTGAELEQVLGLGLAVQTISGRPTMDLTMIEVVKLWQATMNDSTLSSIIGGLLPPGANATETLFGLSTILEALPPATNNPKNSIRAYIILTVIITVIVALRFYTRRFISPKRILLEDWVCLAALLSIYVSTGTLWAELLREYGAGKHIYENTLRQFSKLMHLLFANEYTFGLSHLSVKFAFLAFYHRFSPDPRFKRIIVGVAIYFLIMIILGLFIVTFQCKPVNYWTIENLLGAKCIDRRAAFTAHGALISLTDILLLVLPISQVLKLKLKRRDKALLILVFGTGALICVASVFRCYYVYKWLSTIDVSGNFENHSLWYLLELDISLIVCCAPAIKVFFSHQKPKNERTIPDQSKMSFTQGGLFKGSLWRDRARRQGAANANADSTMGPDGAADNRGIHGTTLSIIHSQETRTHTSTEKDDEKDIMGSSVTRKGSNDDNA